MIREIFIKNSPHLLNNPTAAIDIAAVGIWYARGSREEPDSLSGLAHYIEGHIDRLLKRLINSVEK